MKKRVLATVLCLVMLLACTSVFATAEKIIINGTEVTIPEGMGNIQEKDDRTFVPVRFVMEYLDHDVVYGNTTVNGEVQESVTITDKNNTSYLFVRDDNIMYKLTAFGLDGGPVVMDTTAYIDDSQDRFYVPIRFLAEAIGFTVGWDDATKTVTLTMEEAAVEDAPVEESPAEEAPADEA